MNPALPVVDVQRSSPAVPTGATRRSRASGGGSSTFAGRLARIAANAEAAEAHASALDAARAAA